MAFSGLVFIDEYSCGDNTVMSINLVIGAVYSNASQMSTILYVCPDINFKVIRLHATILPFLHIVHISPPNVPNA